MSQRATKASSLRGLALALGVVGLGSMVCLLVFFAVGGPFGVINDVGNGLLALLSGALAIASLRSIDDAPKPGLTVAAAVALVGTAVAVLGSVLVIFDITGFFFSGLVSGTGFALIGLWLIVVNRSSATVSTLSLTTRHARFGVVAGVVMAVGFIDAPGIVMGIDDMDTAPMWLQVGGAGWAGTYLLFPIWSIWLSRSGRPD